MSVRRGAHAVLLILLFPKAAAELHPSCSLTLYPLPHGLSLCLAHFLFCLSHFPFLELLAILPPHLPLFFPLPLISSLLSASLLCCLIHAGLKYVHALYPYSNQQTLSTTTHMLSVVSSELQNNNCGHREFCLTLQCYNYYTYTLVGSTNRTLFTLQRKERLMVALTCSIAYQESIFMQN